MVEGTTVASAAEKVFNMFELVEAILLHTCHAKTRAKEFRADARMTPMHPITDRFEARSFQRLRQGKLQNKMEVNHCAYAQELQDLFQMQRVNTTFRNVIVGSKQLRQDMFKEARGTPVRKLKSDFWSDEDDLVRHINPIAFELDMFLPFRAFDFSFNSYGGYEEDKVLEVMVALHGAPEEPSETASWRSMLFTKAPMSFEVVFSVQAPFGSSTEYEAVLEEGATLGDFVDAAMKAIKSDMWPEIDEMMLSEQS